MTKRRWSEPQSPLRKAPHRAWAECTLRAFRHPCRCAVVHRNLAGLDFWVFRVRSRFADRGAGQVDVAPARAVIDHACAAAGNEGSFKDFSPSHGIPIDTTRAMHVLLDGHAQAVQAALVNERVFLVDAGLGPYPQLLGDREAWKTRRGRSIPGHHAVPLFHLAARRLALTRATQWRIVVHQHVGAMREKDVHDLVHRRETGVTAKRGVPRREVRSSWYGSEPPSGSTLACGRLANLAVRTLPAVRHPPALPAAAALALTVGCSRAFLQVHFAADAAAGFAACVRCRTDRGRTSA